MYFPSIVYPSPKTLRYWGKELEISMNKSKNIHLYLSKANKPSLQIFPANIGGYRLSHPSYIVCKSRMCLKDCYFWILIWIGNNRFSLYAEL